MFNILCIDDDQNILNAYNSILGPVEKSEFDDALSELDRLFRDNAEDKPVEIKEDIFTVHMANSGLSGIEKFKELLSSNQSVSVCIIDMRMPNGIDGLETAIRIKKIDPDVNIIISTAYSDKTIKEISDRLEDKIYYIRKPFHSDEIYQLVYSLSLSYKSTKAYKDLNAHLEERIATEVEAGRQKDAMMFHQAKMAAYGEMIGNIAHQWRQPLSVLSVILNKINLQAEEGIDKDVFSENMSQAFNTIRYMTQTINDFRELVEPSKEKILYDAKDAILKTVRLVEKNFLVSKVAIECQLENINLHGYPDDLKQVLLVLLHNAKDAINSNEIIESGLIKISLKKIDNQVVIEVSDNGGGINPDLIERIFEPYFTTKHKSQGSGLGLYMASRIVTERLSGILMCCNIDNGVSFCLKIDV